MKTAHETFVDWSTRNPEREFLLQPVGGQLNVITFKAAEGQVRRMASALLGLGLKPGDKVAILGKNSAEWVMADLAIAMAGLISVPVYPTANADTVSYVLGHSEASAVFVGKLDDADSISEAVPDSLPSIAFPYPTLECTYNWNELIDGAVTASSGNRFHRLTTRCENEFLHASRFRCSPPCIISKNVRGLRDHASHWPV